MNEKIFFESELINNNDNSLESTLNNIVLPLFSSYFFKNFNNFDVKNFHILDKAYIYIDYITNKNKVILEFLLPNLFDKSAKQKLIKQITKEINKYKIFNKLFSIDKNLNEQIKIYRDGVDINIDVNNNFELANYNSFIKKFYIICSCIHCSLIILEKKFDINFFDQYCVSSIIHNITNEEFIKISKSLKISNYLHYLSENIKLYFKNNKTSEIYLEFLIESNELLKNCNNLQNLIYDLICLSSYVKNCKNNQLIRNHLINYVYLSKISNKTKKINSIKHKNGKYYYVLFVSLSQINDFDYLQFVDSLCFFIFSFKYIFKNLNIKLITDFNFGCYNCFNLLNNNVFLYECFYCQRILKTIFYFLRNENYIKFYLVPNKINQIKENFLFNNNILPFCICNICFLVVNNILKKNKDKNIFEVFKNLEKKDYYFLTKIKN